MKRQVGNSYRWHLLNKRYFCGLNKLCFVCSVTRVKCLQVIFLQTMDMFNLHVNTCQCINQKRGTWEVNIVKLSMKEKYFHLTLSWGRAAPAVAVGLMMMFYNNTNTLISDEMSLYTHLMPLFSYRQKRFLTIQWIYVFNILCVIHF